ncbi:MAG: hypothetical protein LBS89_06910, partial [Zoogloeaceae bacterium]|nr:hypothetical protein [Zoogloeaceae bacterium]
MSQTTATKHKKSSPAPSATAPRKKSAGGTLVGIFVGLVLGMLIATGVVWYMNKTPVPFMERVKPAPLGGNPNQPPVKLPGKPGDPVPRA